jgi:hypothetical protein
VGDGHNFTPNTNIGSANAARMNRMRKGRAFAYPLSSLAYASMGSEHGELFFNRVPQAAGEVISFSSHFLFT